MVADIHELRRWRAGPHEDCALSGGYAGGAFATGWTRILAALTDAAEADLEEPA